MIPAASPIMNVGSGPGTMTLMSSSEGVGHWSFGILMWVMIAPIIVPIAMAAPTRANAPKRRMIPANTCARDATIAVIPGIGSPAASMSGFIGMAPERCMIPNMSRGAPAMMRMMAMCFCVVVFVSALVMGNSTLLDGVVFQRIHFKTGFGFDLPESACDGGENPCRDTGGDS